MSTSYPGWITKIRKDPLGANGYNRLLSSYHWLDSYFIQQHVNTENSGWGPTTTTGEHNAPEIPRTAGQILWNHVSGYTAPGHRHVTSLSNPATGQADLVLPAIFGGDAAQMAVQVTNMSANGNNKPCLTQVDITSPTTISTYSLELSSALGAGNVWAAFDSSFALAIHGKAYGRKTGATSLEKKRGDFVTNGALDYNAALAADVGLRNAFLQDHTTTGLHKNIEVANTWAHLMNNGGGVAGWTYESSARNPVASINAISTGIIEVTFTNAWTLPVAPLVMMDVRRQTETTASKIHSTVCCPISDITTTKIKFYIYADSGGWVRSDRDFWFVVHAAS